MNVEALGLRGCIPRVKCRLQQVQRKGSLHPMITYQGCSWRPSSSVAWCTLLDDIVRFAEHSCDAHSRGQESWTTVCFPIPLIATVLGGNDVGGSSRKRSP